MRLAPQPQKGVNRFAQTKLRQSDGPQFFKYAPVELLQGIYLFEDSVAMLS